MGQFTNEMMPSAGTGAHHNDAINVADLPLTVHMQVESVEPQPHPVDAQHSSSMDMDTAAAVQQPDCAAAQHPLATNEMQQQQQQLHVNQSSQQYTEHLQQQHSAHQHQHQHQQQYQQQQQLQQQLRPQIMHPPASSSPISSHTTNPYRKRKSIPMK